MLSEKWRWEIFSRCQRGLNFRTRFRSFLGFFFAFLRPFFVSISKIFGSSIVLQTCRLKILLIPMDSWRDLQNPSVFGWGILIFKWSGCLTICELCCVPSACPVYCLGLPLPVSLLPQKSTSKICKMLPVVIPNVKKAGIKYEEQGFQRMGFSYSWREQCGHPSSVYTHWPTCSKSAGSTPPKCKKWSHHMTFFLPLKQFETRLWT